MTNPGDESRGNTAALWREAASFAARAHAGQDRKDGVTPYAAHPTRVAMNVAVVFGCNDPATLAIAFLHDTIEDCSTDYEDLADAFGDEVTKGVAALTKDAALPEAERERHAEARLRAGGWRPILVKLGDVLDNRADMTARKGDARLTRLIARKDWAVAAARDEAERCGEPSSTLLRTAIDRVEAYYAQASDEG